VVSFSIIMPAYNAEKTIAASVQSVLDQTFADYELLLIDDRSKDETYSICEAEVTDGFPQQVVRTILENYYTLKVRDSGFEG